MRLLVSCKKTCSTDSDCGGESKCCFNGCSAECKMPMIEPKLDCCDVNPGFRLRDDYLTCMMLIGIHNKAFYFRVAKFLMYSLMSKMWKFECIQGPINKVCLMLLIPRVIRGCILLELSHDIQASWNMRRSGGRLSALE